MVAFVPGSAHAQREALRPLLLLEDAKRQLARRGDPFGLEQLAAASPSEWIRHQARMRLAGHHAVQGDWDAYRELAADAGPCARLLHAVFHEPGAVDELAPAAQAASPTDPTCFEALNAATAAGRLRDEDIWRQIRNLVNSRKAKRARVLLKLLKDDQVSTGEFNKAVQNATKRIRGKHRLQTRASQELLAVSAIVAAMRDPLLAGRRWAAFAPYIDDDLNADVWPLIGTWAALDHEFTAAMDHFGRTPLHRHPRLALAWRARAAMRLGDWDEVRRTIETMAGEQATFSAWRYWHAHALDELGQRRDALVRLGQVAREFDDFYGLLAAARVGQRQKYGDAQASPALIERLATDADVRLAVALGAAGRTVQARQVWKFLHARSSGPELLAMSVIAARGGWTLGAINAAEAAAPAHASSELRFPTPLRDTILGHVERFGLEPGFVYALIRRESRFDAGARSSAGARGLMQVMPATARAVARRHKYNRYHLSRLTMVEPNLLIGTRYLADLKQEVGDDPVKIAAAYNAGPHRVRRWLRSSRGTDRLVFIETIPFTETRLYVKAVLGATAHYTLALGGRPVPLLERLAGSY